MVTFSSWFSNSSKFIIFFFKFLFSLSLLKMTILSLEMRSSLLVTLSSIFSKDFMIRFNCSEILSTTYSTSAGIYVYSSGDSTSLWSFVTSLPGLFDFDMFSYWSILLVAFFNLFVLFTLEIGWLLGPSKTWINYVCSV